VTLRPPRSPLFPYTTLFRSVFPQVKIRHLRSLPAPPPGRERETIVELTRHVSVGLSLPGGKLSLPHELRIELDRAVFDLFNLGEIGRAQSELQSRENLVCRL